MITNIRFHATLHRYRTLTSWHQHETHVRKSTTPFLLTETRESLPLHATSPKYVRRETARLLFHNFQLQEPFRECDSHRMFWHKFAKCESLLFCALPSSCKVQDFFHRVSWPSPKLEECKSLLFFAFPSQCEVQGLSTVYLHVHQKAKIAKVSYCLPSRLNAKCQSSTAYLNIHQHAWLLMSMRKMWVSMSMPSYTSAKSVRFLIHACLHQSVGLLLSAFWHQC